MPIVWSDKYSVKNQEIDSQHRKLVDLVNELDNAMKMGKGKEVLAKSLNSLAEYTQNHFVAEERLLTKFGYPDLNNHKAEHESLLRQVVQLQEKYKKNQMGLTIPTMTFLTDWLTNHILGTDMKYSEFLRSKGC